MTLSCVILCTSNILFFFAFPGELNLLLNATHLQVLYSDWTEKTKLNLPYEHDLKFISSFYLLQLLCLLLIPFILFYFFERFSKSLVTWSSSGRNSCPFWAFFECTFHLLLLAKIFIIQIFYFIIYMCLFFYLFNNLDSFLYSLPLNWRKDKYFKTCIVWNKHGGKDEDVT